MMIAMKSPCVFRPNGRAGRAAEPGAIGDPAPM
jgi:hypothetical protein